MPYPTLISLNRSIFYNGFCCNRIFTFKQGQSYLQVYIADCVLRLTFYILLVFMFFFDSVPTMLLKREMTIFV